MRTGSKTTWTLAAALVAGGLAAFSQATPASAAALLFTDFSDLTGLQLNGNTSSIHSCTGGVGSTCSPVADNVLRLTNTTSQAGSRRQDGRRRGGGGEEEARRNKEIKKRLAIQAAGSRRQEESTTVWKAH